MLNCISINDVKFSLYRTLEHVEGDILLTMPKISELNDPAITDDMLCQNKDIVEQIEQVVASWEKHTEKVKIS